MLKKISNKFTEKKYNIEEDFISFFTNSSIKEQKKILKENSNLIYSKSSIKGTLLFYLALNKKSEILNYIVDNIVIKEKFLNEINNDKLTLIHKLIYLRDLSLLKKYINQGLNPHVIDSRNRTIVFYIIHENWIDALKYCLKIGIDISVEDCFGKKAFDYSMGKKILKDMRKKQFLKSLQ